MGGRLDLESIYITFKCDLIFFPIFVIVFLLIDPSRLFRINAILPSISCIAPIFFEKDPHCWLNTIKNSDKYETLSLE